MDPIRSRPFRSLWRVLWQTFTAGAVALVSVGAGFADAEIGKPAPAWESLPGVDGGKHSLAELGKAKAVVVVFFDNHCPDCDTYYGRINAVAKEYKPRGVETVLISLGPMEEDNLTHMIAFARERKLSAQYLKDTSQKTGHAFGAKVTPEVFVLDGKRHVAYHGAVDDHWNEKKVSRQHLRQALEEVLAGKPVSVPKTVAKGCDIEYETSK